MNVICNSKELLTALTLALRVVPLRPDLPALVNIMLKAGEEVLRVEACNGQMAISVNVKDVMINRPGELAVAGKELTELVRNMRNSRDISILADENFLVVKAKEKEAKLAIADIEVEEMPWLDAPQGELEQFFMNTQDFIEGLERTKYAAATDSTKQILCGVCFNFELEDERVELAATDGFRLASTKVAYLPTEDNPSKKILLPIEALLLANTSIKTIGEEESGVIEISVDENTLELGFAGNFIRSRRIEGSYPNYPVLCKAEEYLTECTFSIKELKEALAFVDTFANGKDNLCFLELDPPKQNCTIIARDGSNRAETSLKIAGTGKEYTLGCNSRYLKDCLKNMPGEGMALKITKGTENAPGPIHLTSTDQDAEVFALLMPVQVVEKNN